MAFCEQDKWCQKVLAKHWQDVPIFDDVRTLNAETLADTTSANAIDVVCGGFPCQPWSVAGQQKGTDDNRDLWPEMCRIIADVKPQWVIGENVAGFVSNPLGLDRSLADLEALGYSVQPFVIPACAVDAPHRRDRVWIVAHATELQRNGSGEYTKPGGGQIPKSGDDCCPQPMAHTNGSPGEGNERAERSQPERADDIEYCRWLPEPGFCGTHNGLSQGVVGGGLNAGQGLDKRSQAVDEAAMRMLWGERGSAPTPQRPRQDQQFVSELADAMCELPHKMALAERQEVKASASDYLCRLRESCIQVGAVQHTPHSTEALWLSLPDKQTREWACVAVDRGPFHSEWPGTPRVARGVPDRVNRLRGLGNAVVPQVVTMIGRAIMKAAA